MRLLDAIIGVLVLPIAWATMNAPSKTMDRLERARRRVMGERE